MRAATVDDIAREFTRILDEGYNPEPEEFLHRIPDDMREACRARLEEVLAARAAPEPVVEEVVEAIAAEITEAVAEHAAESASEEVVDAVVEAVAAEVAEEVVEAAVEAAIDAALEEVNEAVVEEIAEAEEADALDDDVIVFDLRSPAAQETEAVLREMQAGAAEVPVEEEAVVEQEPETDDEPETAEVPEPTGPVKISREEAKAMFREMELRRTA